jgi:AP-2 complex subunit beta-1
MNEAADAADAYFSGIGSQQMASMDLDGIYMYKYIPL